MTLLRLFGLALLLCGLCPLQPAWARELAVLENSQLGLTFDATSGAPVALNNKLTGESYDVAGDRVIVEAVEFRFDSSEAQVASIDKSGERFQVRYVTYALEVEVTYQLRADNHFLEKLVVLTPARDAGVKRVVTGNPTIARAGIWTTSS